MCLTRIYFCGAIHACECQLKHGRYCRQMSDNVRIDKNVRQEQTHIQIRQNQMPNNDFRKCFEFYLINLEMELIMKNHLIQLLHI